MYVYNVMHFDKYTHQSIKLQNVPVTSKVPSGPFWFTLTLWRQQCFLSLSFFFFRLLGLHPQQREVPRLWVKWELQPPGLVSVIYTIAHDNARSLTH